MKKQLDGIKILVVDDEQLFLDAISEPLIMLGATVYSASNGLEAMDVLNINSVDVILSDMHMPKSDGIDFLKRLRSAFPHTPPFFVLTSFAAEYSEEKLKELGVNDIILKPFTIKQLLELILTNTTK